MNSGSFLHRLDPRTKLLLTVLFTSVVFAIDTLPAALGLMVVFISLCRAAGLPLKKLFPRINFLLLIVAMVIILQMIFGSEIPGRPVLLKPLIPRWVPFIGGLGSIKWDGLYTGLMIGCRIISLAVILPALIMTTEMRMLAFGMTRLGLNYRLAHIVTSALNLIPLFETELRLIMDARRLRGMRAFETGGFLARLGEYRAIAVPLLIKAMRRAHEISLAMDTRAFGVYEKRTWLITVKFSAGDCGALAAGAALSAAAVAVNFAVKG
ncbi:MAG: energy-coupling factor transporter transmembrane protein EcfT [Treponema sp.]|nr:energy-coupling factor transporter transmembrane protein EcfT [Treponema sp.]